MNLRICLAIAALAWVFTGCFWAIPGVTTAADPTEAADISVAENVAKYKAEADAKPGDVQAAVAYSEMLGAAYEGGTVERGRLAGDSLIPDAIAKLDAAAVANPDDGAMLVSMKGNLYNRAGRLEEAMAAYKESMELKPNIYALEPVLWSYAQAQEFDTLDATCAATRTEVTAPDEVYFVLALCASARPGMAVEKQLPWASEDDRAHFERETARLLAEEEERRRAEAERQAQLEAERAAQREREAQAAAAAAASSSSSSSAPAHYSASVSVKNECPDKVRVFRGSVNGSYPGSGTYGWHSSNSISSYSLSGSDELCIVSENDREILGCVKPSSGASLKITKGCGGFANR